jgi:hypothetical protein
MSDAVAQTALDLTMTQYTADWSTSPGFELSGPIWDPHASFSTVYAALPTPLIATITSSNTAQSLSFYQGNFGGVLRSWAFNTLLSNKQGPELITATISFLNEVQTTVQPRLVALYPGYPIDVYKALIVQNLVHGYHVYDTSYYYETITRQIPSKNPAILMAAQVTAADELYSLLQSPVADCGETAEFVRVLGRIWSLDMRYLGIYVNYPSPLAKATVASTHALNVLVYNNPGAGAKAALLVDAISNLAIAPGPLAQILPTEMQGDGIVASASWAGNRYAALTSSGKVLTFFNFYMHPPIRAGYLKAGLPDASLLAFMYTYYLEAYPNSVRAYPKSTGWTVNNAAYSLNQPLY